MLLFAIGTVLSLMDSPHKGQCHDVIMITAVNKVFMIEAVHLFYQLYKVWSYLSGMNSSLQWALVLLFQGV